MILIHRPKHQSFVIPVNQGKRKYEPFTSGGGGNITSVTSVQQTYTTTNVTPDRTLDPTTATLGEVAQVLATLIQDLQTANIIQ